MTKVETGSQLEAICSLTILENASKSSRKLGALSPSDAVRVTDLATPAEAAHHAAHAPVSADPAGAYELQEKPPHAGAEETRAAICAELSRHPPMAPCDPLFMHGRLFGQLAAAPAPVLPRTTWRSAAAPRDDHDGESWLTASEFEDSKQVMAAKIRQLAELIRVSRKTVLYTGAGISASAIGQAARSGTNVQGWKKTAGGKKAVEPTPTHHALALLGRRGFLQGWVQQNHDGLPQKAGYPQHMINEIHGSWFDPGNPVVKYSGSLHDRAFPWMEDDTETADLVIVLGTSLGGLTADQVATEPARRSCAGASLGAICINLQQTPQDGLMTLRLFGKSDQVLAMLLKGLELGAVPTKLPAWPTGGRDGPRVLVPYDKHGRRVGEEAPRMWLDLRDQQRVRITPGHNIQGAQQPHLLHIGASKPYKGKAPGDGTGRVLRREKFFFQLTINGARLDYGVWWMDAAARGLVDVLPVVNQRPTYESARGAGDN